MQGTHTHTYTYASMHTDALTRITCSESGELLLRQQLARFLFLNGCVEEYGKFVQLIRRKARCGRSSELLSKKTKLYYRKRSSFKASVVDQSGDVMDRKERLLIQLCKNVYMSEDERKLQKCAHFLQQMSKDDFCFCVGNSFLLA